jgi:hypothetical protein
MSNRNQRLTNRVGTIEDEVRLEIDQSIGDPLGHHVPTGGPGAVGHHVPTGGYVSAEDDSESSERFSTEF